jgi:hypothetical protein
LYEARRSPRPITEAACWAYGRRKFFVLADLRQVPLAIEAVRRIDEILAVEREINIAGTSLLPSRGIWLPIFPTQRAVADGGRSQSADARRRASSRSAGDGMVSQ